METDKKTGINILKAYLRYLRLQRGFSPNTLDAYQRDLDKLLNYLRQENRDVLEVTLEDLQHFAAGLHDIGIHARSQCRILSGVRQFFHFLQLDGFREDDPSELLESPKIGAHLPEVLSTEEVDLLEAQIDLSKWEGHRNRAIIEVLFSCGLRVSELVQLKLSNLYLDDEYVRVWGKGSKERIVYLNDACLSAIQDYLDARENPPEEPNALFLSRNHRRISRRRVQQIVEQTLAAAGLAGKGLSTHKLRHTAATLMYQHGNADMLTLKEILGHQSVSTTEIYTHLSSRQRQDAIDSNPLAGERRHTSKK